MQLDFIGQHLPVLLNAASALFGGFIVGLVAYEVGWRQGRRANHEMTYRAMHAIREAATYGAALIGCRDRFADYAKLHREKVPPALDKAQSNQDMADAIQVILKKRGEML